MERIALYLGSSGSYSAARDLTRLIANARQEDDAYGAKHPSTLAARSREAGDAAAARDLYAALLPMRDRVSGPEHPDTPDHPRQVCLLGSTTTFR